MTLINRDKYNMEDRYVACIVLFSLGDTIAFKNGSWYIKNKQTLTLRMVMELLYEFIHLGGINGINLNGWIVSVKTFIHIATAEALFEPNFINGCREFYIGLLQYLLNEYNKTNINRAMSRDLYNVLDNLYKKGLDKSQEPYDPKTTNNLSSNRTLSIGLFYNGEGNRELLIKNSILCSKITNSSPIGFLGGLTSALFVSFATDNIDIYKWPHLLINILKSKSVLQYINEENEDDYDKYMIYWNKYIEFKFNKDDVINMKSKMNIINRIKFYKDNFTDDDASLLIGLTGHSSIIIAYDCLLDCSGNWEKLIIYSALHLGDNTATASIAAGLYGIYYGWGDVPPNNLLYLEFREILYEIGKKIYKNRIN